MKSVYKANILRVIGSILLLCLLCVALYEFLFGSKMVHSIRNIISIFVLFFLLRWLTGFIGRLIYVISIDYVEEKISFHSNWFKQYEINFSEIQQIYFSRGKSEQIDYASFYKNKGDKGKGVSLLLLSMSERLKLVEELKRISKENKNKISSDVVLAKKAFPRIKDDVEQDLCEEE